MENSPGHTSDALTGAPVMFISVSRCYLVGGLENWRLSFYKEQVRVWPGDKDGILGQIPLYLSAAPSAAED